MREQKRGENHPNVILTEQSVIKIRKLCDEAILTQKEIGEKFGGFVSRVFSYLVSRFPILFL